VTNRIEDLPDFYAILGVESNATRDEIRSAYRRLAMRHHPDVNPPDEDDGVATELMSRLNEAYETLYDPERRQAYNQRRRARYAPSHPYASRRRPPPSPAEEAAQAPNSHAAPPRSQYRSGQDDPGMDWFEAYVAAEQRFKEQISPFKTLLNMMVPVLATAAAVVFGFFLFTRIHTDALSWTLITYVFGVMGGMQGVAIIGIVLLILAILWLIWHYPSRR
jgi:hypothetical protein